MLPLLEPAPKSPLEPLLLPPALPAPEDEPLDEGEEELLPPVEPVLPLPLAEL